ncbi:MAG: cobyrinate a,c-diamide synthase [Candidatus Rokuibacteriota bacterium]|nr:MAG: cobyrinate a,c-diamide synthase [Candidatus Rokubacteria bacterium]
MTRVLVVAGTASGVGKTSITLGLLAALRRRGLVVQPFKVGPDFIDAGLHAVASGRPSYNLDGWMCGRETVMATVARHAADADVAIVEGVMGCFDGADTSNDTGSTAEIAKWLGAPVVLVVDASAQARSAAATVLGFERFDPALNVAATILNRVGGEAHARSVMEAIRATCRAVPLGGIAREDTCWAMPERYLGLATAAEGLLDRARLERMANAVERGLELDHLLALAPSRAFDVPPRVVVRPRVTIGIARDPAFQFYYAENLDLLRAMGAALVEWSPLSDAEPPDVDGLYFGGGYPELHAERLADNAGCRKSVRRLVLDEGRPVYAECGGLMYLAESLEDAHGRTHEMVGVLPGHVTMRPLRMSLGYVDVTLTLPTLLGPTGTRARGHEFHFSTLTAVPTTVPRAYTVAAHGGASRAEGYVVGRALLSYMHLHFASNPALAESFVDACAKARR